MLDPQTTPSYRPNVGPGLELREDNLSERTANGKLVLLHKDRRTPRPWTGIFLNSHSDGDAELDLIDAKDVTDTHTPEQAG